LRSERSLAASLSTLLRPILDRATHRLNRSSPFAPIALFLIVVALLTAARIAPYDYHMSALIGMEKKFLDLNPASAFEGLVVFRDSGYDGQFFYLIARYLFDPDMPEPVLDTYRMRMGRIGMSLLVGFFAALFGWKNYAIVSMVLLNVVFLLSFLALREMLHDRFRYLSLVYLFSPFSLNSSLLLVSDSLMVSVALIGLYCLFRSGFRFTEEAFTDRIDLRSSWTWLALGLFCFLVLIRDTGLFFLAPLGLVFLYRRDFAGMALIALPLLTYGILTLIVRALETHPGINPIYYGARLTLPMKGFFDSLIFSGDLNPKTLARETSKFLNLTHVLLLIYNLRNIRSLFTGILAIPILLTVVLSVVAVKEYWETFDNVSRMFTLSLPYIALLKNGRSDYRGGGIFAFSIFFLVLLLLRNLWLKPVMAFSIVGN
jgi:hypothetical protein